MRTTLAFVLGLLVVQEIPKYTNYQHAQRIVHMALDYCSNRTYINKDSPPKLYIDCMIEELKQFDYSNLETEDK